MSEGTKRAKGEGTTGAKNAPLGIEGMRQSGVEFRFAWGLTGIREAAAALQRS